MGVSSRRCLRGRRSPGEACRSGDLSPWACGRGGCGARACGVRSEPSPWTAGRRAAATPGWCDGYIFSEEPAAGEFLVGVLGEDDMAILVVVVHVLVGVLDLVGVVHHSNFNEIIIIRRQGAD